MVCHYHGMMEETTMRAEDIRVLRDPEGALFADFCRQKGCNMTGCACWADHELREMRLVTGHEREQFLQSLWQLGEQAHAEAVNGW